MRWITLNQPVDVHSSYALCKSRKGQRGQRYKRKTLTHNKHSSHTLKRILFMRHREDAAVALQANVRVGAGMRRKKKIRIESSQRSQCSIVLCYIYRTRKDEREKWCAAGTERFAPTMTMTTTATTKRASTIEAKAPGCRRQHNGSSRSKTPNRWWQQHTNVAHQKQLKRQQCSRWMRQQQQQKISYEKHIQHTYAL